jgi:hypothetical protein
MPERRCAWSGLRVLGLRIHDPGKPFPEVGYFAVTTNRLPRGLKTTPGIVSTLSAPTVTSPDASVGAFFRQ